MVWRARLRHRRNCNRQCRFNRGAGKHPLYDEPDNSYHGLRWGHDLPEMLAPLAYILRMRTVPLRNLGACISPDNSWMFLQGIETLPLRMDRHCENALKVAKHLQSHSAVNWVRFPGLDGDPMNELNDKYLNGKGGSMVVFGIEGGREAGEKFINKLELFLTSQMWVMQKAWQFTPPQLLTPNSMRNNSETGELLPNWYVLVLE